jgi:integrase
MTVLRRGNSKYWYIQFRIGGKTIIKSSRSTSRKVAEQIEAQLKTQVHGQTYLGLRPSISLSEAFLRYSKSRQGIPSHRNFPSLIQSWLCVISGARPIDRLISHDLDTYCDALRAKRRSSHTVRHGLSLLQRTLKHVRRLGFSVPQLEFPAVRVPAGRLRYLSPTEETKLLIALDPHRDGVGLHRSANRQTELRAQLQDLYDVVVVLLDTGARYGEIASLEWAQIDLTSRAIRLWRPKVRNESVLFMTARVAEILSRRHAIATAQFVFSTTSGSKRGHPHRSWRKAFNRAGLHDCTIHTLRHTHATRLIQNGMSVYEVQTVLGHSDPKTTMRYAHLEQASVSAKARDAINGLNARNAVDNF